MAKKEKGLEAFESFLEKLEPYIAEELQTKEKGEPALAQGLSESDCAFATKLLDVQKSKGFIVSGDLSDSERMKIKRLCDKFGITAGQAVSRFVENADYITTEVSDARRMINVISEMGQIYENEYEKYHSIPVCLLSAESRDFLLHKHYTISLKEELELINKKFVPELANAEVSEFCFDVRNNKKIEEAKKKLPEKIEELKMFADVNGNVDRIFLPENRTLLKELVSILGTARVSFDDFVKNYAGLTYTRIYRLEPTPAVKHMLSQYRGRFKKFTDIRENDSYLESKLVTAKNSESIYELSNYLEFLGFPATPKSRKRSLSSAQIIERENGLVNVLREIYPDGNIIDALSSKHEAISDEVILLAKRKGYDEVDAYLKDIGFNRVRSHTRKLGNMKVWLTENDLLRYRFVDDEHLSDFEDLGKDYGTALADVENNMGTYHEILQQERNARGRVDYRLELPEKYRPQS